MDALYHEYQTVPEIDKTLAQASVESAGKQGGPAEKEELARQSEGN